MKLTLELDEDTTLQDLRDLVALTREEPGDLTVIERDENFEIGSVVVYLNPEPLIAQAK